ncbi:MAG: hypothetical protein U1E36_02155 [Rickettsiales bacterium]
MSGFNPFSEGGDETSDAKHRPGQPKTTVSPSPASVTVLIHSLESLRDSYDQYRIRQAGLKPNDPAYMGIEMSEPPQVTYLNGLISALSALGENKKHITQQDYRDFLNAHAEEHKASSKLTDGEFAVMNSHCQLRYQDGVYGDVNHIHKRSPQVG